MGPQSRLLVAEHVIDPDLSDEFAYSVDLQLLVLFAGKVRTAAEFKELYESAGLRLTRIIRTTLSMISLIEGVPGKTAQTDELNCAYLHLSNSTTKRP